MSGDLIFLSQAFAIIAAPLIISHTLRLRSLVPIVVVQIVVGIILGPSVFGNLAPLSFSWIVNQESIRSLSGIASIAVLIFGFITGLHTRPDVIKQRGAAFLAISGASILIPLVFGFFGGLYIVKSHSQAAGLNGSPIEFASGLAICVSVTALPVLGSILSEMNLLGQRVANYALGVAAVNDAALWFLLCALLTHVKGSATGSYELALIALSIPIYLLLMIKVVGPSLGFFLALRNEKGTIGEPQLAIACTVAIGSAVITQVLGLHYIFGAFIAGAVMPRELKLVILAKLEVMTLSVLMPFFFVITGLRTHIDFSSTIFAEIFSITTALGVIGKFGGTTLVSRVTGESWTDSCCLGALVQTKGLMEVVVLTVLLEQGIISSITFSALTLMAIVSTAIVMPATRMFLPQVRENLSLSVVK